MRDSKDMQLLFGTEIQRLLGAILQNGFLQDSILWLPVVLIGLLMPERFLHRVEDNGSGKVISRRELPIWDIESFMSEIFNIVNGFQYSEVTDVILLVNLGSSEIPENLSTRV